MQPVLVPEPLMGPFTPRELSLVTICLKHIPTTQRHALLYDAVGHALCPDKRTDEGPMNGHWFMVSPDAHEADGRGAIIPFQFRGAHCEVRLPTAHAIEGQPYLYADTGDETLHAQASLAFAVAFIAKFWEFHQNAVLNPRLPAANS